MVRCLQFLSLSEIDIKLKKLTLSLVIFHYSVSERHHPESLKIVADTLSALGKPETKNAKVIQQQATVKLTCVCLGVASPGLATHHHRVVGQNCVSILRTLGCELQ